MADMSWKKNPELRRWVRGTVLAAVLLLIAIATFDLRNGELDTQTELQAQSIEAISSEYRFYAMGGQGGSEESSQGYAVQKFASAAVPQVVETSGAVKVEVVADLKEEAPTKVEKDLKVVEKIQTPVPEKPEVTPFDKKTPVPVETKYEEKAKGSGGGNGNNHGDKERSGDFLLANSRISDRSSSLPERRSHRKAPKERTARRTSRTRCFRVL